MKNLFVVIMLLMFSSSVVGAAAPAISVESAGPKVQIRATVDAILDELHAEDEDHLLKRQKISDLIRDNFDFKIMAQGALGRQWRSVTVNERARFVELFIDQLEETYLGRLRAYTDQTVSYGSENIRKNRAVVETFIEDAGVKIPITYKLLPRGSDWLVYDVVIEEVSMIRNYRSTYGDILRRKGMAQLLEDMAQKIDDLKKRNGAEFGENHDAKQA
ncbi:MAG: ABC transporter substrate-binding protein [Thermodesulfobacteriota bacterium]|nr:ABC transporter substrate-binding protein [Thermodesulfobacteriota bacterium]